METTPQPVRKASGLQFSQDQSIEITIAPNAGACFGVVRAIKLGYQAVARSAPQGTNVYSFGPLIHNPHVVKELNDRGVKTIAAPSEAASGTVILRSHGVPKQFEGELREKGLHLVDATCPLVKKPQRIARGVGEKGFFLVVVGDANHPEIKGVLSYFGSDRYLVTYSPADLDRIPADVPGVGVLAQTTIEVAVFDAIVARAREKFSEVLVYNTICDATSVRQSEALELARGAQVLVVVGGKNSSNTSKLVKICKELQPDTYHIEDLQELEESWFTGKRKIGVTGGASTPPEYVDLVGQRILEIVQTNP